MVVYAIAEEMNSSRKKGKSEKAIRASLPSAMQELDTLSSTIKTKMDTTLGSKTK